MPQGQESQEKLKVMTKVRKSQEIWQNLKKTSDFVFLNKTYKIPYFSKPSNGIIFPI